MCKLVRNYLSKYSWLLVDGLLMALLMYRAADRSAALSLSDGMSHWKNEWKPIIDMLLMFIHHPKRIKSHLRITIDVIASNLDEKVELFCPDRGREADEMMFRSYKGGVAILKTC